MKRKGKADILHNGGRIRIMGAGSFMADFCASGRRRRKVFKTEAHARTAIDKWRVEADNVGRQAFAISDRDRLDVREARKWLTAPLGDVFDFWRKHHAEVSPMPIEELAEKFLDAPGRRGKKQIVRREATTEGHRKRLKTFIETFSGRMANEITKQDVESWLAANGWEGINRRHYLATCRALFAYALREKIVGLDPTAGIDLPEVEDGEPSIMPVGDVEKYLRAIDAACPDLLPREALAFFCGLRPEELTRLDWRHVSLANLLVTVGKDVAKIAGQRRVVEIPENAAQWLAPYAHATGRIWPYASPTTLVYNRKAARRVAGVDVPDNAGRHCFASYHLAAHKNGAATAELLGHSNTKLLRKVYRNIEASDGRTITQADGEAYFNILPLRKTKGLRFPSRRGVA